MRIQLWRKKSGGPCKTDLTLSGALWGLYCLKSMWDAWQFGQCHYISIYFCMLRERKWALNLTKLQAYCTTRVQYAFCWSPARIILFWQSLTYISYEDMLYEAQRHSFWQTTVCTLTVLCGSLGCLTVCGVFAQRTGSLLLLCIWQEQTNIQSVILSLLSSLRARQMYTHIHIFPPAAVTQQKTHQFNFFFLVGGWGAGTTIWMESTILMKRDLKSKGNIPGKGNSRYRLKAELKICL